MTLGSGAAVDGQAAHGDSLERLMKEVNELPKLDWAPVLNAGSLEELMAVPAVSELRSAAEMCGMPRISTGWSLGGEEVSITLKRAPKSARVDSAAGPSGNQTGSPEEYPTLVKVLRVMLCRNCGEGQPEAKFVNELVANFSRATGVELRHVQFNARSQAVRAVFGSAKKSQATPWRYSPSYRRFFGSGGDFLGAVGDKIAREVVDEVWAGVAAAHYVVDEDLRATLDPALLKYVAHGVQNPSEAFTPSTIAAEALAVYMHGGAGVGKSTFVELLSRALEGALRKFVNPDIQVNVVKVALNSMRPEHLQHILRIQGISDWSVERMVEQSIAKEHIAILHLEENPEDEAVQKQLFGLVQGMVDHLVSKYPDRRGNVIFAWTSNYLPCPEIRNQMRSVNRVSAPSADDQFRWACGMLKETVGKITCKIVQVHVDDNARLPACPDLRPLNSWWRSISFFASKLLLDESSALTSSSPAEGALPSISVACVAEHALEVRSSSGHQVRLESKDGFFYCPAEQTPLQAVLRMCLDGFSTPAVVFIDMSGESASKDSNGEFRQDVLDRAASKLRDCEEILLTEARKLEDIHIRSTDLGLLAGESDKEKIYGDASEIRGGLYQFIDDTNNPNVPVSKELGDCVLCGEGQVCSAADRVKEQRPSRVASVSAMVTRVGQFMLRELLETSERSRTHRFSVRKRHLVFFLVALPGESLSEQARSRAQLIL